MIEIKDKIFKTKKEAENFIRTILYKYPLNEPLVGEDLAFVCGLIELHPDKETKIGTGINSIIIESDIEFNKTRHFSIIRADGTIVDFSFKKCLSPNLNESIKLFRSCARRAIANQCLSFRDKFFLENQNSNGKVLCTLTGVLIDKNSSHVDHVPPDTFDKIILDFIAMNNIDVSSTKFIEAESGIGRMFADNSMKESFSKYHKKVAKFRIVSPVANLRQKKK
jgi:hypothetical protein